MLLASADDLGQIRRYEGTAADGGHRSTDRSNFAAAGARARMKDRRAITDADLQDYIEGRLDSSQRAKVEARLASDPGLAEEVERLRRQAVRLQEIGKTMLNEPIPREMLELIEKFPRK
jgi:hypothetical protein